MAQNENCAISDSEIVQLEELAQLWHSVPRRWGHPIHSLCSYFAMFPPQLARVIIQWLTDKGDAVYDPFSGRGTVALESLLLRRISFASDANPLAQILTQAKSSIPTKTCLEHRIIYLEKSYYKSKVNIDEIPQDIQMLYDLETLKQLEFLKINLDQTNKLDSFLIATILGMLHANITKKGTVRGFSISMPNTFAMAPRYVENYIQQHNLQAPKVNVFSMLIKRLEKLNLPSFTITGGRSWLQNATLEPPQWLKNHKAKLILTSPPYLHVIRYGKYNWIRLWFLGQDPKEIDQNLMTSSSLSKYIEFIQKVCSNLNQVVTADGYICFIIGDVYQKQNGVKIPINLAETVWQQAIKPLGWHLHKIIADEIPKGQKVSRIWKNNSGQATKIDRLIILSPNKTQLPPIAKPTWEKEIIF